jgi:AraC-like DNA-binding protein
MEDTSGGMGEQVGGSYVRSVALTGFDTLVARRGGNAAEILGQAGIDPAALHDANRLIGWGALGAAFEIAARELDEPLFGLDLAAEVSDVFPNAVPIVLLARPGDTMLEWFLASATHWSFYTNGYRVELVPAGDGGMFVRLVFPRHSFSPRQVIETSFATLCRLWRSVVGEGGHPVAVHFRHRPGGPSERYAACFGPGVLFEQEHYQIQFSAAQLQARLKESPDRNRALIDWLVRRRLESFPNYDQSMTQTISLVITSIIGSGVSTLDFVARSLSLSPKKLQRLLAQEGTNFSLLLDAVRKQLSLDLLTTTNVGVAQIAGLLDYAGTAPFSLAVRRWHGLSPIQLRHRARAGHGRVEVAPKA